MLRKRIIQKYIPNPQILSIIWHDNTVYSRIVFRNTLVCIWCILGYEIIQSFFVHQYTSWIIASVAMIFFFKAIIDFLNLYLDGIVLTPSGMSVFRREWLLQYNLENFDWQKVEMISFSQNSLGDRLFNTWDISITLDYNISFDFDTIPRPKQQVSLIMTTKYKYVQWWWDDEEKNNKWNELEKEKFDLLVETLGEVIVDYMQEHKTKWKWLPHPPQPEKTKEWFL